MYRTFDPELQGDGALKCIAPVGLGSSSAISGLLREARAASALNHPGIVTVYEVIRTMGAQFAGALAACHACGTIHRDMEPRILRRSEGWGIWTPVKTQ